LIQAIADAVNAALLGSPRADVRRPLTSLQTRSRVAPAGKKGTY